MHLSLFTDYSLRVLMYAALKAEVFQVDEVSKAYDISRNHLAKVIHRLGTLGYLDTKRGRGGGIQLAMLPADIRIGKLVRQIEGQTPVVECFDASVNTCRINGCCRLKGALAEAMSSFYQSLDSYTLQDLTTGPNRARMERALPALKT